MLFASLEFILFLMVTWPIWRAITSREAGGPRTAGLLYLLVISAFFYGCWRPWYLLLIGASTLIQYSVGRGIVSSEAPGRRRAFLVLGVGADLLLLGAFKYGNFLMENIEAIAEALGAPLSLPRVPGELPVGISFYTFQTLSYIIDLYRRRMQPARSLLDFAVYVFFFPQLVAGPIVRAAEFLPQLQQRLRLGLAPLGRGLALILIGLIKKMAIADVLHATIVEPFFAAPEAHGAPDALLALWAANFQVYCDFSGYSDVAIGAALLFGFELAPNFDRPFWSQSPMEHWRRWHISLSTWLKDYLYIELGGSRQGPARTDLALVITFFLGGVWHGAGWRFVLWGLYNGVLLVLWRRFGPKKATSLPGRLLLTLATFHVICLGLVFLHADGLSPALEAWSALSRLRAPKLLPPGGLLALSVAIALHASPLSLKQWIIQCFSEMPAWAWALAIALVGGALSLFAQLSVPFFYFQF